ncbi:hypothetical protein [Desulfosporosinus metallidurans]|uniref:Uncharacterized protein n=1 Tax=Desulfosporosinus metallidurans TaxID=1888891 RepID=A0A1Q8R1Q1_9FIRM|nr:hypothetical protein [Desulfosporosinus metallidurans]OLN33583.1 hypothetical protein DSOL_0293 [Desulfosporosinus metallidurans]
MSGNQPVGQCTEPLNMGIALFAPISSVAGSATLFFTQPLINGRVFASSAVIIGSELFLFIAQRLFRLESLPVLDVKNGQTVQMPLSELQGFLKWMSNGSAGEYTGIMPNRGFLTPETPEAPLTIVLFVNGDYSNNPYSPSAWFLFPILTFPGIRGALPLLILELLATIFVRAVVPPESTGSKPLSKPGTIKPNNPLTFSSNDILQLLSKFRKQGGSK